MNKTYPYVPAIDGLRAFAVLAVLLFHLNASFLPGGFTGVDVFFVISGYVVARSLSGRTNESFSQLISGFYSRRIRRIIPALILCLLVTTLFTVLFIPTSWLSNTTNKIGLYAFFGLSNFALVYFQDDYFSPRTEFNPFVHTWSLGVEEQFYFIFPLLILVWFKCKNRSGNLFFFLGKQGFLLLSIASFISAIYLGRTYPESAYYLLPSRFWELAAGVILFQLQFQGRIPVLAGATANSALALGFLLIGLGYIWSDPAAFPYPWALLPVLGSVCVIWAVSGHVGQAKRLANLLIWPPLLYIGKISYSLYLWHWPVYTLMRWTTGLESIWQMITGVMLTSLLAVGSYHLVETPIRQGRWLAKPNYRAITVGLSTMLIFWSGATELFKHQPQLTLSRTGETQVWYPYNYPSTLPTEQHAALKNRELFIVGNSHTGSYETMLGLLGQQTGMKTHPLQIGQCAFGNFLNPVREKSGCPNVIDDYLEFLEKRAQPGDMVFLASLRTHRLSDHWYRIEPEEALTLSQSEIVKKEMEAAYLETEAIVQTLLDMGLIVLFDAPKPVLKSPTYRCADWFNRQNPICAEDLSVSRDFMEQLRTPVLANIHKLAATHPQVYVWDPLPVLCNNDVCPAYSASGEPLFFDGDHLSAHGNRMLYPSFKQFLIDTYEQCNDCAAAPRFRMPEFEQPITLNETLSVAPLGAGVPYLGEGWSSLEEWGVWSEETQTALFLPVEPGIAKSIHLVVQPFLADGIPEQTVHVWLNGQFVETLVLNNLTPMEVVIAVPSFIQSSKKEGLVLELHFDNATSPADIGLSDDERQLALALRSIKIES